MKLLALGPLPSGGPVTCHPPRSPSNDVLVPSGRTMSSRKTPTPWVDQSLAYAIETSTLWPAYAERSTLHCCQPLELPLAAFQAPVVPLGSHADEPDWVW